MVTENRNKYKIHLSRSEYRKEYLCSPEWERKKNSILKRDQICTVCEESPSKDVHHLNYGNLYDENETDIIGVCRTCHNRIHHHFMMTRCRTLFVLKWLFKASKTNESLLDIPTYLQKKKKIKLTFDQKMHGHRRFGTGVGRSKVCARY